MSCSTQDLTIYQGDTRIYEMSFVEDSAPMDITGWYVYMNIKANKNPDAVPLVTKTVTSHYDPEGGLTKIELTPPNTDLTPGLYFYDVRYKDADGKVVTILNGRFTVLPYIGEVS